MNVIVNDSEPEGDDPLALVAVSAEWAWVQNGVVTTLPGRRPAAREKQPLALSGPAPAAAIG